MRPDHFHNDQHNLPRAAKLAAIVTMAGAKCFFWGPQNCTLIMKYYKFYFKCLI